MLVGIMATLVPYLGSGPFWELMQRWSNICENNWWTNLLYVNNLVNTSWLVSLLTMPSPVPEIHCLIMN